MDDLYGLLDYPTMLANKKKVKEYFLKNTDLVEKRIAVLCGSTFGEAKDFLELFLLFYGIKAVFWEGNYNRYYEEACFPNESLLEFSPELILLHVTNKNLIYYNDLYMRGQDCLEEEKKRLVQIWNSLADQYHCSIIQNNFEYFPYRVIGNAAKVQEDGNVRYIDDMNDFVSSYARQNANFYINDIHYLSAYVGMINWYDDRMWSLYKCPMSMSVLPRYALSIANIVKSILGKNKKAIITDLDNTLWGGVIGEVGENGIQLGQETPQGEVYNELHMYLKKLTKQGVLLNICSKNEYTAGISGLRSAKSILKEEDFIVKKINWNNKPENIKEILQELNLLSNSAVFLDDDLAECDGVKKIIPDIVTLQVKNVGETLRKLDTLSYFERTDGSEEDRKRVQLYQDEIIRSEEKGKFETYDDYLKSLEMICRVDTINEQNIQRVVQLLNKTNQFNFMTNRYTVSELEELMGQKETYSIVLNLEDKFGEYGIVSVAVMKFENKIGYICDWVMSCRVFERKLEYVMLKLMGKECLKRNVSALYGYYYETAKNKLIKDFYHNNGFVKDIQENKWMCDDVSRMVETVTLKSECIKENTM